MSATDKLQVDFKKVPQEENKDPLKEDLPSQYSIEEAEGNQNKNFSCKQFLFGTSKRTALSVCFLVFSLLGVAGFIVGMLIISGDIKIQQHQIVTGFDGKQYNLTNLQIKPEWSLKYNDFIVMQPVLNNTRLLQQTQTEQACSFYNSPDELVTVQQCGSDQRSHKKNGQGRILQVDEDQSEVNLDQYLQNQLQINGVVPEISSHDFVQFDSDGNILTEGNQRLLFSLGSILKPIANIVTNTINNSVNQAIQIAKDAAQAINQGLNIVNSVSTGICKINPGPVTVMKNCFPQSKLAAVSARVVSLKKLPTPVIQCNINDVNKVLPKKIPFGVIARKIPLGVICPRII